MKKKRFLKLVMSYGIQRDKAARMAARVGEFGSYEALFSSLRPSLVFWRVGASVRRAGRTIRQAAHAFPEFGTALAACLSSEREVCVKMSFFPKRQERTKLRQGADEDCDDPPLYGEQPDTGRFKNGESGHLFNQEEYMGRRDLKLDEYNITKLQYRELHNFCLQYADKKRRLADLRDTYHSPRITGLPHGSSISDPTGKTSERAAMLAREIEMIEQTAVEAAREVKYPEEYQNILLSVTNDVPLHFLKLLKDSRLTKYSYDKARRIFYFSLAKKKKII